MEYSGWIVYVLLLLLYLLIGVIVTYYFICDEYEIKNKTSLLTFSTIFAFSLELQSMFLLEILELSTSEYIIYFITK